MSVRSTNFGAFSYYRDHSIFWFRIFGYGLLVADVRTYDPPFSVRIGKTKVYYVGSKVLKFLSP